MSTKQAEEMLKLCETKAEKLQHGEQIPQSIAKAEPKECPHCQNEKLSNRGSANGLRRWKCRACNRSFNALTGTPLARLRKKHLWTTNARCMLQANSLDKIEQACGVARTTAFRWRHRFLQYHKENNSEGLSGLVESDELYESYSEKGSRSLKRRGEKEVARVWDGV